ncbi:glyoxylase-like metal-dependent hydrolase (beta-lactamase superfamily II) [Chryseobacterium nakagawai]|nr:glyoxylase-like metal-dependent hydrolase (beta-lactamase superfamily II) [Chryseobacterium nakagawai]
MAFNRKYDRMNTITYVFRLSFGSIVNYSYIIQFKGTKEILLIDPSWEINVLKDFVQSHNFEVEGILLTHSHFDHTNLADELAKFYNCSIYITAVEAQTYNFTCSNLIYIHTEDELAIGSFLVKPVFSPGHTKGSCCYLIDHSFFSGDTLFIEGCGICTERGADPVEMYFSLQKIKLMLHANDRIYPGHRFKKEVGLLFSEVLKNNIYLQIDDLKYFVDFRMRPNQPGLFNFS